MKDLVKKAGLEAQFQIASAATSQEELGAPVYPPARRKLAEHGIRCNGHAARQLTRQDYFAYDLLIGMDQANLRDMRRILLPAAASQDKTCGDPDGKLSLLIDYTSRPGSVSDPWYTGDFETAWRDIFAGCTGLLAALTAENR